MGFYLFCPVLPVNLLLSMFLSRVRKRRASGRGALCVVSRHMVHLYSLSAALVIFAVHGKNQNERETLSG